MSTKTALDRIQDLTIADLLEEMSNEEIVEIRPDGRLVISSEHDSEDDDPWVATLGEVLEYIGQGILDGEVYDEHVTAIDVEKAND